jgi:hypothetical protein
MNEQQSKAQADSFDQGSHTPGPWRIYDHVAASGKPVDFGDLVICDRDKEEVAVVRFNGADCAANARLLAAAPELLAALAALESAVCSDPDHDESLPFHYRGAVERARAAIAKATKGT